MNIIVTGGAGFIGSAMIRHLIANTDFKVLNIDKLTYAANIENLSQVSKSKNYFFKKTDICDENEIEKIFSNFSPDWIIHFAAESHVDKSIENPDSFIKSNILGTFSLLKAALKHFNNLSHEKKMLFRFHHVSTDEVYGDLPHPDYSSIKEVGKFTEDSRYKPSSPYSASKASSDHLVRSWHRTFGLPILVTNCSNNYGPYQDSEKLIPLVITKILLGQNLPVYGDGSQIRDWLYVDDHVLAIMKVLTKGNIGETYNIGGKNEVKNIEIVNTICDLVEKRYPNLKHDLKIASLKSLITHVKDRPGHDLRYAIDNTKIQNELGWRPIESFNSGLAKTVDWYLSNRRVQ